MGMSADAKIFFGVVIDSFDESAYDLYDITSSHKLIDYTFNGYDCEGQKALTIRDSEMSFDWSEFERLEVVKLNVSNSILKNWRRKLKLFAKKHEIELVGEANWLVGVRYF